MYAVLKDMQLGHLSTLPEIPRELLQLILLYIIDVSKIFAHVHSHHLVHGNFNLSKTLLQHQDHSGTRSMNDILNSNNQLKFFVTNFEPWKVDQLFQTFNSNHQLGGFAEDNDLVFESKEFI